jgi:mannose-6-phosphate isomerase-like protein (cupin superfamily)
MPVKEKGVVGMKSSEFPAFVRGLPEADLPFKGLRGWLLQGESGQVLFNESDVALTVPTHSHGCQWGVVLEGRIDLTVGGQTQSYFSGDTFFIPEGIPHQARIHPGYRAVDCFADRHRYRARWAIGERTID